jgi:hypothetical protein
VKKGEERGRKGKKGEKRGRKGKKGEERGRKGKKGEERGRKGKKGEEGKGICRARGGRGSRREGTGTDSSTQY